METFALLLQGMVTSFEPLNLGLLIFGCLIGLFVGAMPGLGSVNGVAILIPITFYRTTNSCNYFFSSSLLWSNVRRCN